MESRNYFLQIDLDNAGNLTEITSILNVPIKIEVIGKDGIMEASLSPFQLQEMQKVSYVNNIQLSN